MRTQLSNRKAFTLVELLVVISILALLVALLMPAISAAKNHAKTVSCTNNERQLALGFGGYLNDNNGAYPYQDPECFCTNYDSSLCNLGTQYCVSYANLTQNAGGWNFVIGPYLGCPISVLVNRIGCNTCNIVGCCPPSVVQTYNTYSKLFQCPANAWPYPGGGYRLATCNYQMNTDIFPVSWNGGQPNIASTQGWSRRVHASDLNHGSATMLLGEIPLDGNIKDNPWGQANTTGWGYTLPYGNFTGISDWVVTNAYGLAWAGVLPDPRLWLMPDCNAFVATWHNQGMNVLFIDGHVGRVPQAALLSYSVDIVSLAVPLLNANNLPGGIFWTDGKGATTTGGGNNPGYWYANQFPDASYPN